MIPVKLTLHNFMCYADETLDFTGIHTASICGDNGSGKSAIIDALTWALWGEARGTDDELMRAGAPEMSVELDFIAGESRYRILRKRARSRKTGAAGTPLLELMVMAPDGFRLVSGNTKGQTQQEITNVLKLDYRTFINSALLLQGRANEFTRANPAKRKDVLAKLLGLDRYDELEKRAKERADGFERHRTELEAQLETINAELERKPDYEVELKEAQSALAQIGGQVREKESSLTALRRLSEAFNIKQARLDQLIKHILDNQGTTDKLRRLLEQRRERIERCRQLIDRRQEIERGYAAFQAARKARDEWEDKLKRHSKLNDDRYRLERAIEQAGQSLTSQLAILNSEIARLKARHDELRALRLALENARQESARLDEEEAAIKQLALAVQELQNRVHVLDSAGSRLANEIKASDEKLGLLHTGGARCPLCDSELGAEAYNLVVSKYAAEKEAKIREQSANLAEARQKRQLIAEQEDARRRREAALKQNRHAALGKLATLARSISEAEQAGVEIEVKNQAVTDIQSRLARRDFAAAAQAELAKLDTELAALSYNPDEHEHALQKLAELQPYERQQRHLEEAERSFAFETDQAAQAEKQIEAIDTSLTDDYRTRAALQDELKTRAEVEHQLNEAQITYRAALDEQLRAQERLGAASRKLADCAALEQNKAGKEEEFRQTAKEEGLYRELAKAFGQNGIQAQLIEMSLPAIEEQANQLLARMTDNRMHVKIVPQRPKKSGAGVIETLDIRIMDEASERNYDMFSGGEAFRIDFAIRIALSRVLTGRAGAPLDTLIIDEGFGTQDTTGLERLREAIITIQEDFKKILVITHVEELRDAFQTRIDVTKNEDGSRLTVA